MKNKELFDKTISVLVKAFMNNTLSHTTCFACAVGNMVADACGYKIVDTPYGKQSKQWINNDNQYVTPSWYWTGFGRKNASLNLQEYGVNPKNAIAEMAATGYSREELMRIEAAFELRESSMISYEDSDGYHGLMAVVDVLADIHEADEETKEAAKALFTT